MEDAVKMEYLRKRRRFTLEEKTFILEKTNSKCGHCGKHLEIADATLDHIIPLNKGGLNDEYNLLPLCLKCNESKSNYVYDVGDYYEYILPQYQEIYRKYYTFAKHELDKKTLYGYSLEQFVTYPLKHQQIINQMIERKAKPKKIKKIADKLGIHFFLERAYAGDAIDIMKLINKIISNDDIFVDESLYANDYMVLNEIKDGEVYVLRSHVDSTLHGVLLFKKTTYEEMPEQIQNIADETKMSIKYIMTGVFLDYFSEDVLEDLMGSVRRKFLNSRIVPVYFNVLSQIFAAKDAFIAIPYTLDKYDGKLECFPSSYIKEEFRENLVDFMNNSPLN